MESSVRRSHIGAWACEGTYMAGNNNPRLSTSMGLSISRTAATTIRWSQMRKAIFRLVVCTAMVLAVTAGPDGSVS